jgi:hypothetical protein
MQKLEQIYCFRLCSRIYHTKGIDFTQLITKEVLSDDKKRIGHVDGLNDKDLIVKDGLTNPDYYKIPRERVNGYKEGKGIT